MTLKQQPSATKNFTRGSSYFLLVRGLVEELSDLLRQFVVGTGPDASSFVGFDHLVYLMLD